MDQAIATKIYEMLEIYEILDEGYHTDLRLNITPCLESLPLLHTGMYACKYVPKSYSVCERERERVRERETHTEREREKERERERERERESVCGREK